MESNECKGFSLEFPNGYKLSFEKSVFNKKQKSYDVLINDGKNNCWYKIGLIKDINMLHKIIEK